MKWYKEYERIGLQNNLDVNYSMISFELGNVYLKQKKYDKAKEYYFKSISQIKDDLNTSYGYSELCMSLARIYKTEGNDIEARKYYLIAKTIREKIITDEEVFKEFCTKYDKTFL